VPYEIIMALNHISRPEALQAGQTLKLIHGPFNVKIHRSTFTMDLYLQDMFIRSFRVGLGRAGRETPTGLWCVKNRLVKPPWTDPDTGRRYEPDDEDYPLGTRWIGLTGLEGAAKDRTGFAIHGTKNPEEIGTATSRGCIRMYNEQVVLVYDLLVPTNSLVTVED
jgi:lipoprotein-anchoring transpeptidase ErfK/SrfK